MRVFHNCVKYINNYLPLTNHWLILAASIPVALSTGTLFVYSVYGTQVADKCQLDAAEAANLNISATLGNSLGGILSGFLTDTYGTQLPILISCFALSLGYKWVHWQYEAGPDSQDWQLLSAMFLIGVGSVAGYFSAIKAVTVNFPNFKATAQSITVASFAISSLLFLFVSTTFFEGNVGGFLEFMSYACGLLVFIGFIFIRVDGHIEHENLDGHLDHLESGVEEEQEPPEPTEATELLSDLVNDDPNHIDKLKTMNLKDTLSHKIFWFHYLILAIVQGLGQMYIYTIGFIVKAVHYYYKNEVHDSAMPSLQSLQALHVSIIAIASFLGRLSSGPTSDFLVNRLHSQRHWVLILGMSLMLLGHAMNIVNLSTVSLDIHGANVYLSVISTVIGYSYGISFTSYPAIVSDIFNMRNYSLIWGITCSAATIGLTIMTKVFGHIYDENSTSWDDVLKDYVCAKGSGCYSETFEITSGLCVLVIVLILWYIHHRSKV
ncbi:hypothetical protein Cantr_09805 [Candida viswanathii]|uniref:Nodulin-like domain-containing protein n=1 Tax=Candida viswanathii TaxID=5486 RepID=A0A367YBF5_9ASCO|nr:hypothetical protein Cantr_09805 [Candida viswanathii]